MKVAVIGTGKTGGAVLELAGSGAVGFNSDYQPSRDQLREFDCVIVFVPGDAAQPIVDLLIGLKTCVIWGTTGYEWPADIEERVKRSGSTWIIGSNFSLGMNLVRKAIEALGRGVSILDDAQISLKETHHIHKKDKPSGTALSWRDWLGAEVEIESVREGDVKGIHELTIQTDYESISLKHQSHDRRLFAEGAIWAAKNLLENPDFGPGWFKFETFFDYLNQKNNRS